MEINIESRAVCICGTDILDPQKFIYIRATNTETQRKEYCKCRNCGMEFTIIYNLLDSEGHINHSVFSEDINNPEFKWEDLLTEDQKKHLKNHLDNCKICRDRLIEETLMSAVLANLIHSK